MKRVISITGISGYYGSLLLPLLEADDEIGMIRGFDRVPPKTPNAAGSKLEFHQVDLALTPGERNPTGLSQFEALLEGCDTLVHLAFQLMRLPGKNDPHLTNIQGMRLTCNAAARQGVRKLIVTSSVVAYGMHIDNPPVLAEDAPLRPNSDLYYSLAKAGNEKFLDEFEYLHPQMIVTRLRPCTTIGPRADPAMMASLTADPTFLVRSGNGINGGYGYYNPAIQLVHEEDVASALHLAIQKDLPGIYNVTSDDPQPLADLVKLRAGKMIALPYFAVKTLMFLTWRLGLSVFAPEWIDLSRFSIVASNDRLKAAGWEPRYNTAQAFASLNGATLAGREKQSGRKAS